MPWALIAAACFATFAVTASGSTRAPFLIDMAHDLDVRLSMVANIFGVTSVAWGIASFAAGAGSDRWGRRPFMVGGLTLLALAIAGVASADSFLTVMLWATVAGCCCGIFTGVSLAEVSVRVPERQVGRALGLVMSGQSLTLLVGVPLAAWIGAGIGWRGVHLCIAGLALVAAAAIFLATRPAPDSTARPRTAATTHTLRSALSAPVLFLLGSVAAERICFGLATVFYATFLQMTHGLSVEAVALPLVIYAVGNVTGTLAGGRLADRFANRRRTFTFAMLATALVALALFGWTTRLTGTLGLGFVFALCIAVARPPLMAALAEVPSEVRGAVLGLNGTVASLGWLLAAASGGWMLSTAGFAGFGPLIALMALVAAALAHAGGRLALRRV